jgi:hypothetical protein
MPRRRGLLLTEQMGDGFPGCQALRRFAELLGLDCTVNPTVKDRDDSCSRLQVLSPH